MTEVEIKKDLHNVLFVIAVAMGIGLMLFLYTWRNMEFAHLEYEITQLKLKKKDLYNDVETIRVGIASYSTPERLEKLYREKMGYLPLVEGKKIVTLKLPSLPDSSNYTSGESGQQERELLLEQ